MAYFEFPHSRSYDGDLGYIIKVVTELAKKYNTFFEYNTIKFADPINWDITKQYPAFMIVFDQEHDCSMISKQPVPAGIDITNTDFWSFVGPLLIDGIARQKIDRILRFVTNIYEPDTTASANRSIGSFLVIAGELYKIIAPVTAGDTYTTGVNVIKTTIENMITELIPVDTVLNSSSYNAISNHAVSIKFDALDDEVLNILASIGDIIHDLGDINTYLDSLKNAIDAEASARAAADSVLSARIDAIGTLSEGSTTGDAELIDARVGANGITYPSTGDAIRGQISAAERAFDVASGPIFPVRKLNVDLTHKHAGANYKWSLYTNKDLLTLKVKPRFVSSDSTTEILTGTFQWIRYRASSLTDGATVKQMASGTSAVGTTLEFVNWNRYDMLAIVSQYNGYLAKTCAIFGMCYVDANNQIAGMSSFAANQIYADCEYIEYANPVESRLRQLTERTMQAGNTVNYFVPSTNLAGNNIRWGFYSPNTLRYVRYTPTFNYSGSYYWAVYKTADGSTVSDGDTMIKQYEGTATVGTALYFDTITPDMFIEVRPDELNTAKQIHFAAANPYNDTFMLGYINVTTIGSDLGYQLKHTTAFDPYGLSGKYEVLGSPLKVTRWAAFGDSLTEKNNRCKFNYTNYVSEALGLSVVNYGVSGSGYKNSDWDNKAFYQRINNIDPSTFDVLTIMGSINDSNNYGVADLGTIDDVGTTTIFGCVNTTIAGYMAIAEDKPIAIITATPSKVHNPTDPDDFMSLYSEGLVKIAKRNGIPCLDLYHESGLRPWDNAFLSQYYTSDITSIVDTDGIHPNSEGHEKFIAPKVREFIKSILY